MRWGKKRNKIIIFILIGIVCMMGVGYAAFQTQLDIKGNTEISSEWNIKIISAEVKETGGSGENAKNTYTDLTANLEANLYSKGDYVEYNVIVENAGTFDAKLDTLGITNSNNEAVKITSTGLIKGQPLYKGETATLTVRIEYNPNYEGDASGTSGETTIDLGFVQNSEGTIEPTVDHLVTYDYTTNGGESTTAENEYVAEGTSINLSYTATKTNYEFKGWNTNAQASEGLTDLTMGTEDITLYAIFEAIDTTPPVIESINTTSTTNSITAVVIASDEESGISKYEFSINDGNWIDNGVSNTYTFTGLKQGTSYDIDVRVTDNMGLNVTEEKTVSTSDLPLPTFSESETSSGKDVTITYPSGCGSTYTCTYIKDGGSSVTVTSTTTTVSFTESGTLSATVSDGTNSVSSSYTVTVLPYTPGTATNVIDQLLDQEPDELYEDEYGNVRYYGSEPNNYVSFNNELWRVMGVIDGKVKIIKDETLTPVTTDNGVTIGTSSGFYWNKVKQSGKNYNNWEDSTLQTYLKVTYYNSINSTYKNMISEETYYLGGATSSNYGTLTASDYYDAERDSTQVYSGNPASTTQNIGLMYPSDYGYAAGEDCLSTALYSYSSSCKNTDYLFSGLAEWLQAPTASDSNYAARLHSTGYVHGNGSRVRTIASGVRPVLYLTSQTQITGGEGTIEEPFELG